MSAKKLLFIAVSVMCINTNAYGAWKIGNLNKAESTSSTNTAQDNTNLQTANGKKGLTPQQIVDLNNGAGVKVKHMKDKFEGLEKLTPILEERIENLGEYLRKSKKTFKTYKTFLKSFYTIKEAVGKYETKLGFDNPSIRNNPEQDINYDPVEFSSVSGSIATLNSQTCDAALNIISEQKKNTLRVIKRAISQTPFAKARKISKLRDNLTEMCRAIKIKDSNKTPQSMVDDAQKINKIYLEAKDLF